jgi:hypothetical protein
VAQIPSNLLSEVSHPASVVAFSPENAPSKSLAIGVLQLSATQTAIDQANLLAICNLDIAALQQANNIREAVMQVKDGQVRAIREQYGPKSRKEPSTPVWKNIKNAISRRERLYAQLQGPFCGDEDLFFGFFTLTPGQLKSMKKMPKSGEVLRGLRKLVEAIPRMQKDITAQKLQAEYVGLDGAFSLALWQAAWGDQNDWEVWCKLGLESYD